MREVLEKKFTEIIAKSYSKEKLESIERFNLKYENNLNISQLIRRNRLIELINQTEHLMYIRKQSFACLDKTDNSLYILLSESNLNHLIHLFRNKEVTYATGLIMLLNQSAFEYEFDRAEANYQLNLFDELEVVSKEVTEEMKKNSEMKASKFLSLEEKIERVFIISRENTSSDMANVQLTEFSKELDVLRSENWTQKYLSKTFNTSFVFWTEQPV